jgi:hypothetical protein
VLISTIIPDRRDARRPGSVTSTPDGSAALCDDDARRS